MLKQSSLSQFIGTEHYYKHWLGKVYTDGVKYMAEEGQAYWLLDAIFSYMRTESFQIWELKKTGTTSAVLTMKEDTNEPILVKQDIPLTDFPLDFIALWLIDGVLILPSEY